MNIGFLLFPKLTLLDLVGPSEVFVRVPGAKVHLVWKTRDLVSCSGQLVQPSTTFAECPPLDVLCVPGGGGQVDLMEDEETLDFLRKQGAQAKWVTSVCTGSLILAAAGLLTGYRATCHWASLEQLALFGGVTPVDERVVIDRNRVTGGGVTAGIDFALTLVAKMCDEELARAIQLTMEYDPQPPFPGGSPKSADPAFVAKLRVQMEGFLATRRAVSERVAARMRGSK